MFKRKLIYLSFISFFAFQVAGCREDRGISCPEDQGPIAEYSFPEDAYNFLFAGHTYGHFRIKESASAYPGLYPPLLEVLELVNFEKIAFMIFGGDAVFKPEEWETTMEELSFIRKPLYFVKGDHESYGESEMYHRYQPSAVFYFLCGEDLFLVLNSQKILNTISEDQILLLESLLKKRTYRHIFIFFHRLLWVDEDHYKDEKLKHMYKDQNNLKTLFWETVVPILEAREEPVYFFAGDTGLVPTRAFSEKKHANLRFVASGVGSARDENFLIVRVDASGVEISPIYLAQGGTLLEQHDFLKNNTRAGSTAE